MPGQKGKVRTSRNTLPLHWVALQAGMCTSYATLATISMRPPSLRTNSRVFKNEAQVAGHRKPEA